MAFDFLWFRKGAHSALDSTPTEAPQPVSETATSPQAAAPPGAAWGEVARAVESLVEVAREAGAAGNERDPLARVRALLMQGTAPSAQPAMGSRASMSNEMGRWQQGHDPRFRPYTPLSTDALRTLARTYDVLAACVHHLKSEVVKVPLLVVPRDGCANTRAEHEGIARARAFFGPRGGLGGPGVRRASFEGQLLDDLLVLGACAVHFEFGTRGDWLDGTPSACRALDAATIRPLVGADGFPPRDDEACYEQWVNGVVMGRFSRHELLYEGLPTLARTDSPYHLSLVEMAAMTTYTALKSDEWNRAWLTDGNGRGKYIKLNESVTPDQAAQWLEIIDLVTSGSARERHKLGALPGDIVGSDSRKDADFQAFEHWLATRVMSVLGVNPASIGFNGGQYEANQEAAMGATREGTVAQLLEWRSAFYDDLLERLGYPFLQVVEDAPAKPEAPQVRAARQKTEIESGLKTLNEVRRENGLSPVDGGDVTLLASNLKPLSQVVGQDDPQEKETSTSPARIELASELGKWERKCLKRLAQGKSVTCEFESGAVPTEVVRKVMARLEALESPSREGVRQVFELARYEGQPREGGRFSFGKSHAPDDGGASVGGGASASKFVEDPKDLEGSGSRYGTWRGTPDEFVKAFADADVENSATYDSSGNQLCHIVGQGAEVHYPLSQSASASDGLYVHNHPNDPPLAFSDGDLWACKVLNLKEMRVVTKVEEKIVNLRLERVGDSWNLPGKAELRKVYAQAEIVAEHSPHVQQRYRDFEVASEHLINEGQMRALSHAYVFESSLEANRLLEEHFKAFKISLEYK